MQLRPFRRTLIGAASLLAALSLAVLASTNADAAGAGRAARTAVLRARAVKDPAHTSRVPTAALAGPAPTNATLASSGNDQDIKLQALQSQTSFRYTMHWEVSGSLAKEFIDSLREGYGDYPDLLPQTSSASFAAAAAADKTFSFDVTGAYVFPNRVKETIKVGDNSLTRWYIGRNVTLQYNKEKPTTLTMDADEEPFDEFAFTAVWDQGFWLWNHAYKDDNLLTCKPIDDKVNDTAVRKCTFDLTDDDQVSELLAVVGGDSFTKLDSSSYDLWLANQTDIHDVPIRFRMAAAGKDDKNKAIKLSFSMEITDLAKKTVTVDAGK